MNDLKEIGGFIVSADPFVQHDNSLSGNGTVNSPLGVVPVSSVSSDLIVITEETIGTYTLSTSDTNVNGTFSKAGYKPIAFNIKVNYAGSVEFNSENTKFNDNDSITIQGYAQVRSGTRSGVKFVAIITWLKVS